MNGKEYRFPERAKRLMRERKMSPGELAIHVNVHESMVNRWLAGLAVPKGPQLAKMAELFGTTMEWLCGFEAPANELGSMDFGKALEQCVKLRRRIARTGWNGKNMCVAYQPGYPQGIPCNENTANTWGMQVGDLFRCRPYLQLRCADGTFQMWVATQSDILANDWVVVE